MEEASRTPRVVVALAAVVAADTRAAAAVSPVAGIADGVRPGADPPGNYFRGRTQSTDFAIEFAGRMPRQAMLG